ncbi:DUF294 nucleotidyltransferase-like domain-containing protein [Saccharicrinis sp. FJH2]|uniref:DUF294 nucleotidyltransferase-like domain-containing protein n=1 Tax=Saccharicrinis sp. FJH65 TaxID=3344659 RepID=UPI0035F2A6C7
MTKEERIDFLRQTRPFDLLPEEVLEHVAELMEEKYYTKETLIYRQDETKLEGIDIIVEGQYDAFFYDSNNVQRLDEVYKTGYVFGGGSVLLNKKVSIRTVVAKKGTRILFMDKVEFKEVCRSFSGFFNYFTTLFAQKVLNDEYAHFVKRHNTREGNFLDADQIYSRRLNAFESRDVVFCAPYTSLRDAAKIMKQNNVPCLFVEEKGQYLGFVTHRSIIEKGLAENFSPDGFVEAIMETPVVEMSGETLVYEAILTMFREKINYILVRTGDHVGVLDRHRLLSEHAQSPLLFIQSVKSAWSVKDLKEKWDQVPEIVNQLLGRGVNAAVVNQIVTTISDSILHRVIEGVLKVVPEPPAKFAFFVLGSEGRKEQTLLTDQDNAIIYEDKANEHREEVREYFLHFATLVSERLDRIGFSFCKGGYMAKNPDWTHSLSHWKRNYEEWINQAGKQSAINVTTFFDCRFIHGDPELLTGLFTHVNALLEKASSKFYWSMANNALLYEPPITLFNTIRTFEDNERKVVDIKKAMTPIVDLARMLCLRNGINKTNTGERLLALREKGILNQDNYREFSQAYYYLMGLRLKAQAKNIIHDYLEPTNFIEPAKLTQVEQITLKEIFKVIKNFQSLLKLEFGITGL